MLWSRGFLVFAFWIGLHPCEELIIENEMGLVKNTLLETLRVQRKAWSLSFELMPTETLSGWSNILHFTKKYNLKSYGDRTPGIWFNSDKTTLHICSAINGLRNYCHNTDALPLNAYTKVQISQLYDFGTSDYLYLININESVRFSINNHGAQRFRNLKIYASDPWYQAAKAKVKNFKFWNLREKNFMNAPSLKDERPVSHDDVKMRGCILYISQTHQNLYYAAWFKDGAKLANGTLYLRQNNRRRVSGLSIKNISYQDEGNYQCVLYKNNRPIAYSTEFSLKLYDLVRTRYRMSFNLTTANLTTTEIMENVDTIVRKLIPSNDVRNITQTQRNDTVLSVEIFVYSKNESNSSDLSLYASTKQLLQVHRIGSFNVNVVNHDFCSNETVGDIKSKGEYIYPVSKVGEEISKQCQYGPDSPSIIRRCMFDETRGAYWTQVDLHSCFTKSKTSELKNLNTNIVCSKSMSTNNCTSSSDISKSLLKLTQKPQDLVGEDIQLISNILVKIADGIHDNVTTNQMEDISRNIITVAAKTSEILEKTPSTSKTGSIKSLQDIPTSLEYVAGKMVEVMNVGTVISASSQIIGMTIGKIQNDHENVIVRSIKHEIGPLKVLIGNDNATKNIGEKVNISGNATFSNESIEENLATMDIPSSIFQNTSNNISIYSLSFKNGAFFQNDQTDVGSSVLSVTINNKKIENLQTPIDIQFKINQRQHKKNLTCRYWSENEKQWDMYGLTTITKTNQNSSDDGYMFCQTTHLTNFALIFDVGQSNVNPLELKIITWIGCGISLACLSLTVLSFAIFRRIRRKLVPKLLICLSLSLMCLLVTFLAGGVDSRSKTTNAEESPDLRCQIVAGLLHFFILNTFMWMLVQAVNLYRSFVTIFKSNNRDSRFLFLSFMFCTGIPGLIVFLTALITKGSAYGNQRFCVVQGNIFYYTVLLPTCLVLVINFTILVCVIRSITKSTTAKRQRSTRGNTSTATHIQHSKIVLACSVLLGLTWLFGVFAVSSLTELFQYLFCIFNSLQGFFIFMFFIVTNEDVLREWKILLGIRTAYNSSNTGNVKTATFMTSKNVDLKMKVISRSEKYREKVNETEENEDCLCVKGMDIIWKGLCRCKVKKRAAKQQNHKNQQQQQQQQQHEEQQIQTTTFKQKTLITINHSTTTKVTSTTATISTKTQQKIVKTTSCNND